MSDHQKKQALQSFRHVYNYIERCRNAEFESLGITSSQAAVLIYLFNHRGREITQKGLQASLLITHSTLTGLLQRLEIKGFIHRFSDPKDRRCRYVELTPKGCDIEHLLIQNSKGMDESVLSGLTPEEVGAFEKALHRMTENLRRVEEEIFFKSAARLSGVRP